MMWWDRGCLGAAGLLVERGYAGNSARVLEFGGLEWAGLGEVLLRK